MNSKRIVQKVKLLILLPTSLFVHPKEKNARPPMAGVEAYYEGSADEDWDGTRPTTTAVPTRITTTAEASQQSRPYQ